LVLGLLASFAVTRLFSNLLFGVTATDPSTYVAVFLVIGVITLLACWIPARRAIGIHPMEALRHE
jgi:ABC-type antimicrobial peptide transport system permease subunit